MNCRTRVLNNLAYSFNCDRYASIYTDKDVCHRSLFNANGVYSWGQEAQRKTAFQLVCKTFKVVIDMEMNMVSTRGQGNVIRYNQGSACVNFLTVSW